MEKKIDLILQKLDNIEGDVKSLKSDVTGLKIDVKSLKSDVTGLKIDVKSLKSDVKELNGKVDNLEKIQKGNFDLLMDEQDRIYNRLDERLKSLSFKVIELETAE